MKIYGPITNNPGKNIINKKVQYGEHPQDKNPYIPKHNGKYFNINGFFMVFPKHVLLNNMYDKTSYFDPKLHFGGNEVEWFKRFLNKGGIPFIVPKTFVYHYKLNLWNGNKLNDTCIFTINFGNYEGKNIFLKKNSDIDVLYFTDVPSLKKNSIINKCIVNNIIFLYIDTSKYKSDNWWSSPKQAQRLVKTAPHLYLPLNYQKSVYLDGDRSLTKKIDRVYISKLLDNVDIVCYNNPYPRGNPPRVINEKKTILKQKLENKENLNKIWNILQKNKFPDNIGLSETSLLIRKHNNIKIFSNEWSNLVKICIRDQMSFEYSLWKHGVKFKRYNIKHRFTKKLGHKNPKGRFI